MEKPEALLQAWLGAVNGRNIDFIISLYNKDAILIPTFSNRILNTSERIRIYFEQFKNQDDLKVTLHEKTLRIQQAGDNIFILSGIYTWHFSVENEPLAFESRFSFLLDLKLSSPIIHHHSSQIPRML